MTSPARDVVTLLQAAGVGSEAAGGAGWLLRVGGADDAVSQPQVWALDSPGGGVAWVSLGSEGAGLREPSVQVRIRGRSGDYAGSYEKAQEVFDALHGKTNLVANGTIYQAILSEQAGPIWIGYDEERRRPEWSVNFRLVYYASSE